MASGVTVVAVTLLVVVWRVNVDATDGTGTLGTELAQNVEVLALDQGVVCAGVSMAQARYPAEGMPRQVSRDTAMVCRSVTYRGREPGIGC